MKTQLLRVLWNLTVIAALAVYLAQTSNYPAQEVLFPRLVGYPVLALAVISLISEGVGAWRHRPPTLSTGVRPEKDDSRIFLANLIFGILAGIVYLVLWLPLGFILDTVLFLLLFPILLNHSRRQTPILAAIAIGMALLFSFLFHLGAGAILPRGLLNVGWF